MTARGLPGLRRKSISRLGSSALIDIAELELEKLQKGISQDQECQPDANQVEDFRRLESKEFRRLESKASFTSCPSTDTSPVFLKQQLTIATGLVSSLRLQVATLLEESKTCASEVEDLRKQNEKQALEIAAIQQDLQALADEKDSLKYRLRAETAKANDFQKRSFLIKEQLTTTMAVREKETATRVDLIARGQHDLARALDKIDLLEAEIVRKGQRELELQREVVAAAGPLPERNSVDTETQTVTLDETDDKREQKQLATCLKWFTLSAQVSQGVRKPPSAVLGTQTDPICFAIPASEQREVGTMTDENHTDNGTGFGRYWDFTVAKALPKRRFLHVKGTYLSMSEMLHFISDVYAEKVVEDELDDRAQQPRKTLPEFLHAYLVAKHGSKREVDEHLVNILANILNVCERSSSPMSSTKSPESRLQESGLHLRAITFARFLGLGVCGLEPISLHGLNAYLDALLSVQGGKMQLLDPSTAPVVDRDSFSKALELTLGRYTEPLSGKSSESVPEIMASLGSAPLVELDAALARLADAVEKASKQREKTLVDLYASVVEQHGCLPSLDEFHEILSERHREGSSCAVGVRQSLQLYRALALWPTLNAQHFVQAAECVSFAGLECEEWKSKRMPNTIPASEQLLGCLHENFYALSNIMDHAISKAAGSFEQMMLRARWDLLTDMVQQRYKPELSLVMLASVADKCGMQVSVRGARSATASPISAAVPATADPGALRPRKKLVGLPKPQTRGRTMMEPPPCDSKCSSCSSTASAQTSTGFSPRSRLRCLPARPSSSLSPSEPRSRSQPSLPCRPRSVSPASRSLAAALSFSSSVESSDEGSVGLQSPPAPVLRRRKHVPVSDAAEYVAVDLAGCSIQTLPVL